MDAAIDGDATIYDAKHLVEWDSEHIFGAWK